MSKQKLIRDKIPEIIERSGMDAIVTVLGDDEYVKELYKKLQEEVDEYVEDKNTEELADILEVVYALAELHGASPSELEVIRAQKAADRGAFKKKLFLADTKKRI